MASLVIPSFFGSIPRRGDRLLQEQHAVIAENVQARTGYLAGRAADEVRGDVLSDLGYVYRIPNGGTDFFLQFAQQNISVVRGPLANDEYERYYYAGEGDNAGAKFNTKERILAGQNWYDLGVPRFSTRPSLSIAAAGSGTPELRFYVITYCDIYGHESAPTNPRRITCNDDAEILVGWDERDTYPASRAPLHTVKIYRTVPGVSDTAFYFVAEQSVSTSPYIDEWENDDVVVNDILASTTYDTPPTGIEGMVVMPNGFLAGWRGRDILFSEPYRPHAWPRGNVLSVEDDIVGLGVFDQSLAVLTVGTPYVASGVSPEGMSLVRLGAANPCLSRRSIVELTGAVLYASEDGIAAIDLSGQRVLTQGLITREDWRANYHPEDIIAARDGDNSYVAYHTTTKGFELDFSEQERGIITLTNALPVTVFNSDSLGPRPLIAYGTNVYMAGNTVDEVRAYRWRSKEFYLTQPVNFGALQVNTSPDPRAPAEAPYGSVKVFADGVLVYEEDIVPNEAVKLGSGFKAQVWQFEFVGTHTINRFMIAETEKELASV
jgi:hypothetical protein